MRYLLYILLICCGQAFAQGYADNWVIKNGVGLNFTTGSPILFSSSAIDPLSQRTPALSCISDKNGNLLFYKSNTTVYHSSHVPMENGQRLFYYHQDQSYSAEVILPIPNSDSLFAILHVGYMDSLNIISGYPTNYNFYYSIVDISQNNGLGKVISKNVPVIPTSLMNGKIINGNIEPIFNESKNRYEIFFLLSTTGTNPTPTKRMVIIDSIGTISLAPISNNYATHNVHIWNNRANRTISPQYMGGNNMYLRYYQYNPNANSFNLLNTIDISPIYGGVLMCFSPSSQYLFVFKPGVGAVPNTLLRYDLSQGTNTAIVNSVDTLFVNYDPFLYIKQAPNQKLYIAHYDNGSSKIGEITYPDSSLVQGNFIPNAILPQENQQFLVFPQFVPNWLAAPPFALSYACQDSVVFDLTYKTMIDSVRWDFGDPASGAANTSTLLQPVHHYSSYGKYYVQVATWWQGVADTLADTVFVEPSPHVQLPNDTLLCAGESLALDIGQGFAANYLWNTGSTDSTLLITKTGMYVATAYNNCGSQTDTLNVVVLDPPQAQLKDTSVCDNFKITLHFEADSATYLWSTGETTATIYPTTTATYSVDVANPCGQVHDQAFVEIKKCICNVYLANAFTPDGDGLNDTFAPVADCPDFTYNLIIFDRWGNKIAEITEKTPPWDGTVNGQKMPLGVYTYQFSYRGTEYGRVVHQLKNGMITIVQ